MTSSQSCTFCDIYKETLEHLFWECHFTKSLWFELSDWLNQHGLFFTPSFKTVILGDSEALAIVQHIILITKEYIYRSKLKDNPLSFRPLQRSIRIKCLIEKHYMSAVKFLQKWGSIIDSLDINV